AHEAATGLVVAAPEQVEREQQGQRKQRAARNGEDGGVHGWGSWSAARRWRVPASTAAAASAASASTVISPSVSSARKSTMITFTRLRPLASGTLAARKNSDTRSSNG